MDLEQLRRAALASREFFAPAVPGFDGVTATLRVPTRFEVQIALKRCGGDDDAARLITLERMVLSAAIVGWTGARITDILPDHPNDDPLVFEPGAVPLLLDAQPDLAQAWGLALFERMRETRDRVGDAEKNS